MQSFSLAPPETLNRRIPYSVCSSLLCRHWIDHILTFSLTFTAQSQVAIKGFLFVTTNLCSDIFFLCAGNCFAFLVLFFIFYFCTGTNVEPHYAATGTPLGGYVERQVTRQGTKLLPLVEMKCIFKYVLSETLDTCDLLFVPGPD